MKINKLSGLVTAQIVLLVFGSALWGGLLKNDISSDMLRTYHKVFNLINIILSIAIAIHAMKLEHKYRFIGFGIVAGLFIAGAGGYSAANKPGDNYNAFYGLMIGGFLVALISSVVLRRIVHKISLR